MSNVPAKHKFATADLAPGGEVIMYGVLVGKAMKTIRFASVAKHPNVFCKLSGRITEADWRNWRVEDCQPFLDVVFELSAQTA